MSNTKVDNTRTQSAVGIVFATLIVTMLMSSLGQMIFATALPTIVGDLGGVDHMSWVITAFLLAQTIAMPIIGKLGDMIGRKHIFMMGIAGFVLGSVIGALTSSMTVLIIARAIQGFAGGTLMVTSQAIMAEVVPARERGRYMGIMGATFGVSSVLGPVLGGWFTDGPGWRWGLWMNVPLGALAFFFAWKYLQLPRRKATSAFDLTGMAVLILAASSLILVTTWGGTQYEWTSPTILGLAGFSLVAWIALIFVEKRAATPLIPVELFRVRNFSLTTAGGLVMGVAMFGTMAYLPTYLQMVHHMSPTAAGLMMTPMMLGMIVTSTVIGQVISRTGHYRWYPATGMAMMAVALYLLSTLTAESSLTVIGVYLFVMGIGIGIGMQVLVLIVQNSFPLSLVGTATAANNFFRQIGGTVGSSVVGALFIHNMQELLVERMPSGVAGAGGSGASISNLTPTALAQLPEPIQQLIAGAYNDGLTPIFGILMPLMVLAAIILLFIVEEPLKETVE